MLLADYMGLKQMFKIPSIEGIETIIKTPYDDLMSEIQAISGYETHRLKDSFGGRPIYGFSLGDTRTKPVMYIQAQIHGAHEWRTTHWVKRFMEILANPTGLAQSTILNDLKARYSFYFIPCVNPDGYANTTYRNANEVAIDRNFDWEWETTDSTRHQKGEFPFSETESQNIRDVVLDLKPVSLVCCHTWGDDHGLKVRHPQNKSNDLLLFDFFKSTALTTESTGNQGVGFIYPNSNASAYSWAGELVGRTGRKIVTTVLESGSRENAYNQSLYGINGLYMFCIYVDKYLRKNQLVFN